MNSQVFVATFEVTINEVLTCATIYLSGVTDCCIISGGHLNERLGGRWVQGGCSYQSVGPIRLSREHSYKGESIKH